MGSNGSVTWTVNVTGTNLKTAHNITLYDIDYTHDFSVTAGGLVVAGASNFNHATVSLATTKAAINLNAAISAANLTLQSHAGIAGNGLINAKIMNGSGSW